MSYFSQVKMKHDWLELIDNKSNDINIFGGDDNSIMRARCSFKFLYLTDKNYCILFPRF